MKLISALYITCCLTFFGALTATAQFNSMAMKAQWLQLLFAKLTPDTPEYTAIGYLDACDDSGTVQFEMQMNLAVSTNAFVWESDVSKAWPMPARAKAIAKQMRIDKMVFLIRKNQQRVYTIYPNLQACVESPIPASADSDVASEFLKFQFQKTPLGQESVDGHPCVKNKLTDPPGANSSSKAGLVWNAADLQGFPIRIELPTSEGHMRFQFQKVIIRSPGAWLFQVPANYTFFTNSADLTTYAKNQALMRNGE